ncbi:glycine cleavage system aminomethyltransferase GcvT [Corynebacterium sp. zg-331]|uniref:glycine cleavage system aminomethyltransferase GcvT n=1 Tax=unclassified Corynebacterium TaxID=2624378 RepID=UPI00128B1D24|nr:MULTISPECIES: glycine cleavage system aminomethyltransferase GcvT [unclassified Corynebacterium]MBC3185181.1 glycine cleavage system aminomethyltransferase GcvT [Corynebacterium sp. zg-331]MPV51679.1 glycine cleavage system aminomethyltransferase GcvT [Corynebacterium sp. zg331]
MSNSESLRRSPLHAEHEVLGASFTPFGQWSMPLKYGKELDEHRAVRTSAGLFDLSHMGEVRVTGPQAAEFLDYALVSQLSALAVGRAKYSMIVRPDGGILDDLITYRLGDDEFLVVPNASNTDTVVAALHERAEDFDVTLADESTQTALIAVQGPQAEEIVRTLLAQQDHETLHALKYYAAFSTEVAGIPNVLVARTGYTGEDGFELFTPNATASTLWAAAVEAGRPHDLRPAGLAARDSLRLEAAMPLYGNELSVNITPIDAGLGVLISKKKSGDFVGREALSTVEQPVRILVGLASEGKRAARAGAAVLSPEGSEIGVVTSGQPSPTLGHPIALAYVDRTLATPGAELTVDIRGKHYPFHVVETPFYRRSR